MTQLNPSTTAHLQALALMRTIQQEMSSNKTKQPENMIVAYQAALADYLKVIGKPLMSLEPLYDGEPPLSRKFNRIVQRLEDDINILADQATVLNSAGVQTFNTINTEIERARNLNSRTVNKLKTLQMYSSSRDSNTIVVGDTFKNRDLIDDDQIPATSKVSLDYSSHVTLGKEDNPSTNPLKGAKIKILPSSNGFSGNNQELAPESLKVDSKTNQITEERLTFIGEKARNADLSKIIDSQPTTWFEYEYYQIKESDRALALDLNFVYRTDNPNTKTAPSVDSLVDWASGPGVYSAFSQIVQGTQSVRQLTRYPTEDYGKLKLDLEIELKEIKKINSFSLIPYGMKDAVNHPILVRTLEVSSDGTNWTILNPANVWIANRADLSNAQIVDSAFIGTGVWTFEEQSVKYLRVRMEQHNPISVNLGHIWWETRKKIVREEVIITNEFGDNYGIVEKEVGGERVEGPIPPVSDPFKFTGIKDSNKGELLQRFEAFGAKRWAIGIRDINLQQINYRQQSVLVSRPFKINGVVDRVSLDADFIVPASFDPTGEWVKFYISPDDGLSWFRISRIQDSYNSLPEIIAFNDPLPEEFHEQGVEYYTVDKTVDSITFKAELSRPGLQSSSSTATQEVVSSTPIFKGYQLKIRKR